MSMFKEVAGIRTADMLELPVPKANFDNIAVKPSEIQKDMVAKLAERAEKVRKGNVDASVDNMLKITNDGRKLALDQRMLNDMLPDFEGSKINACVDNVYRIWNENSAKKSAQLIDNAIGRLSEHIENAQLSEHQSVLAEIDEEELIADYEIPTIDEFIG